MGGQICLIPHIHKHQQCQHHRADGADLFTVQGPCLLSRSVSFQQPQALLQKSPAVGIIVHIEELHLLLPFKPSDLPLGVPAALPLDCLHRIFQGNLPLKIGKELFIADGLSSGGNVLRLLAAVKELFCLLQEAPAPACCPPARQCGGTGFPGFEAKAKHHILVRGLGGAGTLGLGGKGFPHSWMYSKARTTRLTL